MTLAGGDPAMEPGPVEQVQDIAPSVPSSVCVCSMIVKKQRVFAEHAEPGTPEARFEA